MEMTWGHLFLLFLSKKRPKTLSRPKLCQSLLIEPVHHCSCSILLKYISWNTLYFLSNLCTVCIISLTDGVNLGTCCKNLCTCCVIFCSVEMNGKVQNQELSIGLIPFQTIYVLFCKLAKVANSAFFVCAIFLPQKLRPRNLFDKYQVCTRDVPLY